MTADRKTVDPNDGLAEVMAAVWPDGVPGSELNLAARLSPDMRKVVARRLDVVVRWTLDDRASWPTAQAAADAAGVSRPRFYALVEGWLKGRSLAAMGARVGEDPVRAPRLQPEVRRAAADLVRKVLVEDPDAKLADVMRAAESDGTAPVSPSMIRRLVLQERRNSPPGVFGEEVVFDSVGLDAFRDGERMRLHLAMDGGTGLVLGWAEATNRSHSLGHVRAAEQALARLDELDLACFVTASKPTSATVFVQRNDDVGASVLASSFRRGSIPCTITKEGLGRRATMALGERLGSVWIGSGERDDRISYRYGKPGRMPEFTSVLSLELEAALRNYNGARYAAARMAGVHGAESAVVRAGEARVLRAVADARPDLEKSCGRSKTIADREADQA